jgi:N-acetylneuraminic acid mutarotase
MMSGPLVASFPAFLRAAQSASNILRKAAACVAFVAGVLAVAPAAYAVQAATPAFSLAPGTYSAAVTLTITDATPGAIILYSANGAQWKTYTAPLTVTSTETLEAYAIASDYSNSALASATYTIGQPVAAGAWAWMSGSSTLPLAANGFTALSPPGVYGTVGVAQAGNVPGGRSSANTWKDRSGNLWIFGGYGADSVGAFGTLNDLWEFNPANDEWAWMSGSSTMRINPSGLNCQPGIYGSLGVALPGNVPGGRQNAVSWTDSQGDFWLFGGNGCDYQGTAWAELDDLWEFNPSSNEWTWMGGSNTGAWIPSVYGTLGVPASGNMPGARDSAASWTDANGNLWLFGGNGTGAEGNGYSSGALNDLWEFSPFTLEWTWMGGSTSVNPATVYGTLDVPSSASFPGGRSNCATWADPQGKLWLFGGGGTNEIWTFSPTTLQWAWMGGSSSFGPNGAQPGVYGTLGVPAAGNIPGARSFSSGWIDQEGNLWLMGGEGYDSTAVTWSALNDLWRFNPATLEWTWMGGSSTARLGQYNCADNGTVCGQDGVYGSLTAYGGFPGGRQSASSWTDSSGNFWLFGGFGFDAFGKAANMNDMWVYQPLSLTLLAAATPAFGLTPGTYSATQTVTISDTTTGATIYYTTDGTMPTTNSAVYSGPITVSSTETIEAIAVAPGYSQSSVASATYNITTSGGGGGSDSIDAPTLPQWGVIAMGLFLVGFSIFRMRPQDRSKAL